MSLRSRFYLSIAAALHLASVSAFIIPSFVGPERAKEAFIQWKLVPDILSSFNPIFTLGTSWHFDGHEVQAELGKLVPRADTADRPIWTIPDISPKYANKTFVVAMVDPDDPTPQNPNISQIRHFLGGGFKLQRQTLVNTTAALSEYFQPTPPNGSDPHRYTFLLYEQSPEFPTSVPASLRLFNISAFAEQYKLGPPLAGNFVHIAANKTSNSTS
ncbi:PEBP-like protein [Sistotremastrum suecicum HHB10207 ss-3]|uniref:PEBP-like protein n=1 Tax=Sistotremastrum suecicum HHB10207 ss-3 TaxID=1314776 RepID=A0A165ZWC3_9AGAM|nr:PEBP-like protein [Sistotremastrum suecicum HHB10207 ss-3]